MSDVCLLICPSAYLSAGFVVACALLGVSTSEDYKKKYGEKAVPLNWKQFILAIFVWPIVIIPPIASNFVDRIGK